MSQIDDCRPYLLHMHSEHQRVRAVLHELQSTLAQASDEQAQQFSRAVCGSLEILRDGLAQHFRDEEAGGCIEEAVCRCPSLSREANQLEGQHCRLLGFVDELIRRAEDRPATQQRIDEVRVGFDELVHELRTHEASENAILERAFGVCVDEVD